MAKRPGKSSEYGFLSGKDVESHSVKAMDAIARITVCEWLVGGVIVIAALCALALGIWSIVLGYQNKSDLSSQSDKLSTLQACIATGTCLETITIPTTNFGLVPPGSVISDEDVDPVCPECGPTGQRLHPTHWRFWGRDKHNTAAVLTSTNINPTNVGTLTQKWNFTTKGPVSCTPTFYDGIVYVTDHGGYVWAIDTDDGTEVWSANLTRLVGGKKALYARTSPAIYGDNIYFGTQGAAYEVCLNRLTGDLVWATLLDAHIYAAVAQSSTVHNGLVFVGVSSTEDLVSSNSSYPCCTFIGSMNMLDAFTGEVVWTVPMLPGGIDDTDYDGYSGAPILGSSPAIDSFRNLVYVSTGNLYAIPESAQTCIDDFGLVAKCVADTAYADSVLAIDITTGAVKWATRVVDVDPWNAACIASGTNCPSPAGPGEGFAQAPMIYRRQLNENEYDHTNDLVVAMGKDGVAYIFDPDNGTVLKSVVVGPGGQFGGMEFGSSLAGGKAYVSLSDSSMTSYIVAGTTKNFTGSSWARVDILEGAVDWQTPDPSVSYPTLINISTPLLDLYNLGPTILSPATYGGGVVFGLSSGTNGALYALDATTGAILFTYPTGTPNSGGVSISHNSVYFGTGAALSLTASTSYRVFKLGL